jgi:hypothetical protein
LRGEELRAFKVNERRKFTFLFYPRGGPDCMITGLFHPPASPEKFRAGTTLEGSKNKKIFIRMLGVSLGGLDGGIGPNRMQ